MLVLVIENGTVEDEGEMWETNGTNSAVSSQAALALQRHYFCPLNTRNDAKLSAHTSCPVRFSFVWFAWFVGRKDRAGFETLSAPSSLAAALRGFTLITRTAPACASYYPSCVAVYPRDSQSRRVLSRWSHQLGSRTTRIIRTTNDETNPDKKTEDQESRAAVARLRRVADSGKFAIRFRTFSRGQRPQLLQQLSSAWWFLSCWAACLRILSEPGARAVASPSRLNVDFVVNTAFVVKTLQVRQ